ncbi:transposase for insertion sequence [Corynebacterium striatum]|nr:transposase for insertion sequence [Corynebacterium striatum]STD56755.1 transposase for insertion sequence [Corynebacterium striatum]STD61114.1 transposase for insertion sequence [Corynebacterium striatum]
MTTVSPKKSHDPARGNEISEKLMKTLRTPANHFNLN